MKTLYIDCGMGAAGDMLAAALLELTDDADSFVEKLNGIGIPKVRYAAEKSVKCGITGTYMRVTADGVEECADVPLHSHAGTADGGEEKHDHAHHYTSLAEIRAVIDRLDISEKVKKDIVSVYEKIAEAESRVHGTDVSEIHFHEVGTLDAIADVAAVCMLMDELSVSRVIVSPVHVGSGSVVCAHGVLPVPAPATALLLKGCPIYGGEIEGELCTPTGAALLTHFATAFGAMPVMTVRAIGYGMGKKDFKKANCVRVMLGDAAEPESGEKLLPLGQTEGAARTVVELSCNIDDMTAEEFGFAMERLFDGGALEVFTVPCNMKKERPGQILYVICEPETEEALVPLLFLLTTTLGIRRAVLDRYRLKREMRTVQTEFGAVQKKCASGFGVNRFKYEYEDLAKIAREQNMSLAAVRRLADEGKEE